MSSSLEVAKQFFCVFSLSPHASYLIRPSFIYSPYMKMEKITNIFAALCPASCPYSLCSGLWTTPKWFILEHHFIINIRFLLSQNATPWRRTGVLHVTLDVFSAMVFDGCKWPTTSSCRFKLSSHWKEDGWTHGLSADADEEKIAFTIRESNLGHPVHSQLLYWPKCPSSLQPQ